jgi:hypothetical protein
MKVSIIKEAGYLEALYGLGLSYDLTSDIPFENFCNNKDLITKMRFVSQKLYDKEGGHNKFLESIYVWIDITAPRFLYSEIDTYRIGSTKQSQSTMHTLLKNPITQDMFEYPIPLSTLNYLEILRQGKDFIQLKNLLPEGFLQRRIWVVNYKTLRNILHQRKHHKLDQWKDFCKYIYNNIEHDIYFKDIMQDK